MIFSDFPIRLVDVSQYQDRYDTPYKPNFDKLIAEGFKGAGIRVGLGIVEDRMFKSYWQSGKGKIARMPYWYFDYYSHRGKGMTIESWATVQAGECWDSLKADPGELPLHIDCEPCSYGGAITILNSSEYARGVKAFMVEYKRLSGRNVSMYFSPGFMWVFGDWFKDSDLWLAWYNKTVTYQKILDKLIYWKWRGRVKLWQYASDGDINNDGIADGMKLGMESAALDLNVFLGTVDEWKSWLGVPTSEDEIIDMSNVMNIQPFSQQDARWKDNHFGTTTIGADGCLITCVSMMLKHLGYDTDPARLNTWLIANSGYSGNLFVWASIERLLPGLKFTAKYTGPQLDKIDESLAKKIPVMVHVDYNPDTSLVEQHWVLVVGKSGAYYVIIDPRDGSRVRFEDVYGDPATHIYNVATYSYAAPVTAFTDAEKLAKLWQYHPTLH